MSFSARAYRILIASPSDVNRERELAVQAIQEWNDANSADRQVVLLPVRWETHSAPEYNQRPQAVINKQFADGVDAVVGIFWTRLGSPTGEADSGTIEEIQRADAAGKPVMLYFSSAPQNPDDLDLEQLANLREFKKKTWRKALVGQYSDIADFKEKFLKQLDINTRSMFVADATSETEQPPPPPITSIELQFGDSQSNTALGSKLTRQTGYIEIEDFGLIPDYVLQDDAGKKKAGIELFSTTVNANYFRQRATRVVLENFFTPIGWWLKNSGGIGARDVYVDLVISTSEADAVLVVKPIGELPKSEPTKMSGGGLLGSSFHPNSPGELIEPAEWWKTSLELRALQPQREVNMPVDLLVGATRSCVITVDATIYADTLSRPTRRQLTLDLEVTVIATDSLRLMADLFPVNNGLL